MSFQSVGAALGEIFLTRLHSRWQYFLALVAAAAVGFLLPVRPLINDWDLNITGLWTDMLQVYSDPARVYPPWALLLLLPIRWIGIEGVKILSVFSLGLLVQRRQWPFFTFFLLVFSPFFLNTMYLVNFDIVVVVLPILLWEISSGKRWGGISRGAALSFLLLKPQTTFLLILYFVWQERDEMKRLLVPLLVVVLVIGPISFAGSPPLVFQWIGNLVNPSSANQFYWSINNISLSAMISFPAAAGVILLSGMLLINLQRHRGWQSCDTCRKGVLLVVSMLLSPYTSRQSVAAGLSFMPSVGSLVCQYVVIFLVFLSNRKLLQFEPALVFLLLISTVLFFRSGSIQKDSQSWHDLERQA